MGVVYNKCGGGNAELELLWSGSASSVSLDLAGYDYIAVQIDQLSPLVLATRQNDPSSVAGYFGYRGNNQLVVGEIKFSDTNISIDSYTPVGYIQLSFTKIYGVIGL